ncbi:hypothetical protein RIF29_27488 [Crotalaria pallida]|uniref:Late embryogenesis abundant protein LEA-2 subgroup domain-containing protein n=1 Tax=Crotalaria pallida TaxID=3830 RepID=A0AAN9EWD1_CROPI
MFPLHSLTHAMQPPPSMPATGYPAPPYPNGGGHPPPPPSSYPYTAYPPPQRPQYYPNPNPNNPPNANRSFFRAFIATMVCLVVIFGVILIITWLVLRPTLPSFQLTSLSVSDFNTSTQSLSATWHLSLLARNRNKKMSVTYNALSAAVFYRSHYLTASQLAPFKQDTKSETTVNATLSVAANYVEPGVIADVNRERERGSVLFDVQVLASTSYRSGSWRFRSRYLKVICRKVAVGISSNATSGDLIGGPKDCEGEILGLVGGLMMITVFHSYRLASHFMYSRKVLEMWHGLGFAFTLLDASDTGWLMTIHVSFLSIWNLCFDRQEKANFLSSGEEPEKPEGWLDDEPEEIDDAETTKP